MSKPIILRHGEHIKAEYTELGCPQTPWVEKSTDTDRADGQFSGVVKRFARHQSASPNGLAFGLVKNAYQHAVEYAGIPDQTRGIIIAGCLPMVLMPMGLGFYFASDLIHWGLDDGFYLFMFFIVIFGISCCLYLSLKIVRLELFRPTDEPVIFDRKNRKVYRLFREVLPGIRGMLRPWPVRAVEYEWDLIDVEHEAVVSATGSTVTRYHVLIFIVRKDAADPTIIDSFNIGNGLLLGEQTVPAVWEHIRRFMEDKGPHLPPGETLAVQNQRSFIATLAAAPVQSYCRWWREEKDMMIASHLLFPLFLPIIVLWTISNWLSHATAFSIEWPQEVRNALEPLSEQE